MGMTVNWMWINPRWICNLFGHKKSIRLYQRGNEDCDCGADHTYMGCSRCRQNLEDY